MVRRFVGGWISWRNSSLIALAIIGGALFAAPANAHDAKSKGQRIYVPVYSAIGFVSHQNFNLAVTLSFRNLDALHPITVMSATYFDTSGKEMGNLIEKPQSLKPFESSQLLIKQSDFPGDIGGNLVVEWSADELVTLPMVEAIMVGARGSQAFSFSSRGVALHQ